MTQKDIVLAAIKRNGSITSMQAYDLGVTRLAAVIFRLREDGHDIVTESETGVTRSGARCVYARYRMVQ